MDSDKDKDTDFDRELTWIRKLPGYRSADKDLDTGRGHEGRAWTRTVNNLLFSFFQF